MPVGTSVSTLHGRVATQPSLAFGHRMRLKQKGFLILTFKGGLGSEQQLLPGEGREVYLFPQFILSLLELPSFPNFPLAVGVIEPITFQSLTSPSCQLGGDHHPPEVSLGSFFLKSPNK